MNDRNMLTSAGGEVLDPQDLRLRAMAALRRGEFDLAEQAIARGDATLQELIENLRTYQFELHMQAEELQRSQAQTQMALDRFTTLFASLPVASLLIDANGVVIEANQRAERDFGLGPTMMRGYLFHRLVHADDYQAEVRGAMLDARATGHADVSSVRFRARAGTQIVGDLHMQCLTDNATGLLQYACVLIDRTQQISDLEQLHASLARLQARERASDRVAQAGQGAPVGVLVLDPAGVIQWASEDLLQLFGYSGLEMVGRPLADLLRGGEATTASEELARLLGSGAGCRFSTVPAYRSDGGSRAVSLDLMPVRRPDGQLTQYLALVATV